MRKIKAKILNLIDKIYVFNEKNEFRFPWLSHKLEYFGIWLVNMLYTEEELENL